MRKSETESRQTANIEAANLRLKELNENQRNTIRQLQEKCEALMASGEEMGKEIATLKKSNAGLRGYNGTLQKEIEKYNARYCGLSEENNENIESNTRLARLLGERNKTISGLESQVSELAETARAQANKIEELKGDVGVADANLAYYKSLPWYKKIFAR